MATVFSDTFTTGSNTTLASHTPTVGTSWSVVAADASCSFTDFAASNTLKPAATVANSGMIYKANATYGSADYYVEATIVAGFTGTNRGYLIVRMADVNNMYALRFTTGASVTRMYKKVAGTWTALGSFIADPAVGNTVRLQVSGTTLTYYYNGVLKDTQTATDLSAAGAAGLAHGGGANLAASTDDVLATSELDTFNVVDGTSGGGTTAHNMTLLGIGN